MEKLRIRADELREDEVEYEVELRCGPYGQRSIDEGRRILRNWLRTEHDSDDEYPTDRTMADEYWLVLKALQEIEDNLRAGRTARCKSRLIHYYRRLWRCKANYQSESLNKIMLMDQAQSLMVKYFQEDLSALYLPDQQRSDPVESQIEDSSGHVPTTSDVNLFPTVPVTTATATARAPEVASLRPSLTSAPAPNAVVAQPVESQQTSIIDEPFSFLEIETSEAEQADRPIVRDTIVNDLARQIANVGLHDQEVSHIDRPGRHVTPVGATDQLPRTNSNWTESLQPSMGAHSTPTRFDGQRNLMPGSEFPMHNPSPYGCQNRGSSGFSFGTVPRSQPQSYQVQSYQYPLPEHHPPVTSSGNPGLGSQLPPPENFPQVSRRGFQSPHMEPVPLGNRGETPAPGLQYSRSEPAPPFNRGYDVDPNQWNYWERRRLPHQTCNMIEKWPKFSGDSSSVPVIDFLNQIDVRCRSYRVSKEELKTHAHLLFKDDAYTWYTAYERKFDSWDTLLYYLRLRYDNPNRDRFTKEMRARKQRPNELFSAFMTDIELMSQRLRRPMSEAEIFEIVVENMKMSHKRRLALHTVVSLEHLAQLCYMFDTLEGQLYNPQAKNKNPLVNEVLLDDEGLLLEEEFGTDGEVDAINAAGGRTNRFRQSGSDAAENGKATCWNCQRYKIIPTLVVPEIAKDLILGIDFLRAFNFKLTADPESAPSEGVVSTLMDNELNFLFAENHFGEDDQPVCFHLIPGVEPMALSEPIEADPSLDMPTVEIPPVAFEKPTDVETQHQLTTEQKNLLFEAIQQLPVTREGRLGRTHLIKHPIELIPGATGKRIPSYRWSPAVETVIDAEMNLKSPRIARWALKLSKYDLVLQYKKGSENISADALSRSVFKIDWELPDPYVEGLKKMVEQHPDRYRDFKVVNGDVFKYITNSALLEDPTFRWKRVVPLAERRKLVETVHNEAHLGYLKTLGKVRERFYWPRMASDVKTVLF
ncbi:hypothetical protein quinque_015379 [Culex quinquefasciatus]